jgi:hypothetical protein
MHTAYHLTPTKLWEQIKESGSLEPRSLPTIVNHPSFCRGFLQAEKKLELGFNSNHVVGALDSPDFNDWNEFGLYDSLLRKVSGAGKKCEDADYKELALLSFKVPSSAVVRDHYHVSPKTFIDIYGEDLWHMASETGLQTEERCIIMDLQLHNYYDSVTRITDYQNDFKVPEVWIPERISLEKITLEKVFTI